MFAVQGGSRVMVSLAKFVMQPTLHLHGLWELKNVHMYIQFYTT
jgi:hypothetical protein